MCLAALAIGSTVASGALQMYSTLSAGQQASRIANSNAARLNLSANDALERGHADAEIVRQQTGQIIGQQRALLAGGGNVDISRGSAANLSASTAGVGELEVLRTMNNAAREAHGLRTQSAMVRYEGQVAKRQSYLSAGATLLTAGSSVFGMGKQIGKFGNSAKGG